MTDNTNKGFWERMARIYTAFMSKNDTAFAGAQRRKQRSCASSVLLHMENNQRSA